MTRLAYTPDDAARAAELDAREARPASTVEWTDAEASDLEDLAINLGHVDDDPEVILRRTREIHETVRTLVAARERMAAARALRDAADYDHEDHWTDIALGGIDYVRSWLHARADRTERGDR